MSAVKNRHRVMMECLVLEGLTPREVSKRFDISESRLSVLRKSALWQIEEENLKKDHLKDYQYRLASLIPKAIDALEESVVSHITVGKGVNEKQVYNDPRVRISAAREILGRSGLAENVEISNKIEIDKTSLIDSISSIRKERDELVKELGLTE